MLTSPGSSRDSGCGESPSDGYRVKLRPVEGSHLVINKGKPRPESIRSETSSRSSGEHDEDIQDQDVHVSAGNTVSVIELPTSSTPNQNQNSSPINRVSIMVPSGQGVEPKSPLLTTDDKLHKIGLELLNTEEHYVKELYLIDQVFF